MFKFDRQGLIPAVIQDDTTGEVLMVAFMNEEALRQTRETGYTHFFSRSRNTIWRKGEQSGHVQQVREIRVNCEENSLLIRVVQHGEAACHDGYRSCYYRRLLPNDKYEVIAERLFDPSVVYHHTSSATTPPSTPIEQHSGTETTQALEYKLRQLYEVYLLLRDQDLSQQSHTSRLLQEKNATYLLARLADEIQELTGVQRGEHVHNGRQPDTILESSQVGYWLFLLAATYHLSYNTILPHHVLIEGYAAQESEEEAMERQQECLRLLATGQHDAVVRGLQQGFAFIGWACAQAQISPLAPAEFDLEQMRRKGLVKKDETDDETSTSGDF
jgi:phosphoribosyl-AMP cyclohydrolase